MNYELPVCESENEFYFRKNESENLESYSVDAISELLKENGNKTHVYIPGDASSFVPWLSMNLKTIMKRVGISGTFSCMQLAREFLLVITPAAAGAKLSGTVTGFGEESQPVTVTLSKNGTVVSTKTVTGNTAGFDFGTLEAGTYTVEITREGHFAESRTVTVETTDVVLEVAMNRKGDINGDGKLNNKDALMLMQYFAGWDVAVAEYKRDVNRDGKQNNKDFLMLMQFLAGWDVVIYPS